MDSQITLLLESARPQDRKKAIEMLAKLGDPEAFRILARVYKTDPDPDIRDLAVKAGKEIKRATSTQEVSRIPPQSSTQEVSRVPHQKITQERSGLNAVPPPRFNYPQAEKRVEEIQPVFVSPGKQSQAQQQLQTALDLSRGGQKGKAIDHLIKAFKTNPNYRLESYPLNTAANITGLSKADFLEGLEDETRLHSLVRQAPQPEKKKNKSKNTPSWRTKDELGEATWTTILIDLAIYFVVVNVVGLIMLFIAARMYQSAAAMMAQGCDRCSAEEIVRLRDLLRSTKPILEFAPLQGIAYSLLYSLFALLPMAVYYSIMHSMVHMFLTTDGSFRGMLEYCARFNFVLAGIIGFLVTAALLMILRDLYDPHFLSMYRPGSWHSWQTVLNIAEVVFVVGGLWSLRRVVTFYRVGCFQVGCVILISSAITSAAIGTAASRLLDSTLTAFVRS
jgi:hypothetical protein